MQTRNPRISTVVDEDLAIWLHQRARAESRSVSTLVREVLVRFYAEEEERFWAREAEARLATFEPERAISHEDAWK